LNTNPILKGNDTPGIGISISTKSTFSFLYSIDYDNSNFNAKFNTILKSCYPNPIAYSKPIHGVCTVKHHITHTS